MFRKLTFFSILISIIAYAIGQQGDGLERAPLTDPFNELPDANDAEIEPIPLLPKKNLQTNEPNASTANKTTVQNKDLVVVPQETLKAMITEIKGLRSDFNNSKLGTKIEDLGTNLGKKMDNQLTELKSISSSQKKLVTGQNNIVNAISMLDDQARARHLELVSALKKTTFKVMVNGKEVDVNDIGNAFLEKRAELAETKDISDTVVNWEYEEGHFRYGKWVHVSGKRLSDAEMRQMGPPSWVAHPASPPPPLTFHQQAPQIIQGGLQQGGIIYHDVPQVAPAYQGSPPCKACQPRAPVYQGGQQYRPQGSGTRSAPQGSGTRTIAPPRESPMI